jgi:hypothetical protein
MPIAVVTVEPLRKEAKIRSSVLEVLLMFIESIWIAPAILLPERDTNGMVWFFFASAASNGLASTARAARQPDPLVQNGSRCRTV